MTSTETFAHEIIGGSQARSGAMDTLLWGTLAAGALDICAAMVSVQLRGIPALQAVKGVAAGWLGVDAFRGGAAVIALGFVTHFLIMSAFVLAFYAASRAAPALARHWLWTGAAYGAAVYLFMAVIVVPLSAFPRSGPPSIAALIQNLLVHVVCVGLPIAFITRRFSHVAHISGE